MCQTAVVVAVIVIFINTAVTSSATNCDEVIRSADSTTGHIQSPNYPRRYDANLRCLYYLVGRSNERIQIYFVDFEVNGVLPRCLADYVDVYTQVRREDEDLLSVPLHGRYCGSDTEKLPTLIISMTNILVVGFFTTSTVDVNVKGFRANYTFIDDSVYNVGTPAPDTCGQTIDSIDSGELLSPTYPGMYPDHIFCFYKIHGSPGKRIRLTFTDIDLYYGGEHCPFDYIKVYDGANNEAPEIDTYCGSISDNLTIYSTGPNLNIVFETKSGRAEATKKTYFTYDMQQEPKVERRGFRAEFNISDSYVNTDVLQGSHVRGTECDQVLISHGESNGTVSSPYYPQSYPLNVRCIYYIDGLQDKQHLEKVQLRISDIDIPRVGPRCEDNGYLQIYRDGDPSKSGYQLCGNMSTVQMSTITTRNPRLLMIFDSGQVTAGRGFNATYRFITDYAIEGTPATSSSKCSFIYLSSSGQKFGTFISPRHPSNYPDNTVCDYKFIGRSNEQVRITFENFKVENGDANCSKDHVQVYNVAPRRLYPGGPETLKDETLVGVYCGDKLPGPQMSEENSNEMRVRLTTNHAVVETGFRAKYEFVEKSPDKQCVTNITDIGGDIKSPNHPNKYYTNRTCEWYIYSRHRQGTIMLIIDEFKMEGNPQGEPGCGNCVLKIYTDRHTGVPTYELCGENKSYSGMTIHSQGNLLRLKFISSAKAVGGKGFVLSWTELLPGSKRRDYRCSDGFRCKSSHYCIAKELQCNGLPNCGHGDTSDETHCGHAHARSGVLNIILGVVLTAILVIVVAFCVVQLRRRKHRKKQETVTVHFLTRSAVADNDLLANNNELSASTEANHRLFTEQTEKVSIV